jgi:hypothetical protein
MTSNLEKRMPKSIDSFPSMTIMIRWILVASEMILASYIVIFYQFYLGLFFIAYGAIAIFLLLPLIRCVRCYYYGKRCNFGWGVWVAKLFPRAENSPYPSTYGYSFLFWPIRLIPIAIGFIGLPTIIVEGFDFSRDGLFLIYLFIIIVHRLFYRNRACSRCNQRPTCPVYNIDAMAGKISA